MTSPVLALTIAFSVAVGTGGVGPGLMGGLVLYVGLGPYLLLESGAVAFSVAVTLLESGLLPFLDRSVIGILDSGLIPLLESGLIPLLDGRLIRILDSHPVTITVAGHRRRRILASGAVATLGGIPNLITILVDRHQRLIAGVIVVDGQRRTYRERQQAGQSQSQQGLLPHAGPPFFSSRSIPTFDQTDVKPLPSPP